MARARSHHVHNPLPLLAGVGLRYTEGRKNRTQDTSAQGQVPPPLAPLDHSPVPPTARTTPTRSRHTMSDNSTPERPDSAPAPNPEPASSPPLPSTPPSTPPDPQAFQAPRPMIDRRPGPRRRTLVLAVIAAVVVAFLAGGGVTWWVLGEEDDDVRDHVEVSGGELVADDSDDAYCDDDDIYSYNDCDTDPDETYEFSYRITNQGTGPPTTPSSSTPSTRKATSSARPTSARLTWPPAKPTPTRASSTSTAISRGKASCPTSRP